MKTLPVFFQVLKRSCLYWTGALLFRESRRGIYICSMPTSNPTPTAETVALPSALTENMSSGSAPMSNSNERADIRTPASPARKKRSRQFFHG